MNYKLPDSLLKDLKEVAVDPEEIFQKEIVIALDTKPLQIVINSLMTEISRQFLNDYIFGIENGFKDLDGTYTLFNYSYERLKKLSEIDVSDKISSDQLPIYTMSKKMVLGILSYFIEMHQQDE